MFSRRFQRVIYVTHHASERMTFRRIDDDLLCNLIETGVVKYKDSTRLWIFKAYENRDDNLICAAISLEENLVVKTVMHHFDVEV